LRKAWKDEQKRGKRNVPVPIWIFAFIVAGMIQIPVPL